MLKKETKLYLHSMHICRRQGPLVRKQSSFLDTFSPGWMVTCSCNNYPSVHTLPWSRCPLLGGDVGFSATETHGYHNGLWAHSSLACERSAPDGTCGTSPATGRHGHIWAMTDPGWWSPSRYCSARCSGDKDLCMKVFCLEGYL